jgi:hypothetical protein
MAENRVNHKKPKKKKKNPENISLYLSLIHTH